MSCPNKIGVGFLRDLSPIRVQCVLEFPQLCCSGNVPRFVSVSNVWPKKGSFELRDAPDLTSSRSRTTSKRELQEDTRKSFIYQPDVKIRVLRKKSESLTRRRNKRPGITQASDKRRPTYLRNSNPTKSTRQHFAVILVR